MRHHTNHVVQEWLRVLIARRPRVRQRTLSIGQLDGTCLRRQMGNVIDVTGRSWTSKGVSLDYNAWTSCARRVLDE